jgi:hypothetical protein
MLASVDLGTIVLSNEIGNCKVDAGCVSSLLLQAVKTEIPKNMESERIIDFFIFLI